MKDPNEIPEKQVLCPFCGASLPDRAAFCPHCARSIRPPARRKAPRPLRKKLLYLASLLAAAAMLSGASGFLPVPRLWRGRAAYPIIATAPADTVIYIHPPAVTYEGGLSINGRAINPLGSQEGRTIFTSNTQVTIDGGLICCFDRLDFRGDGSGIGLSASARVHLTNGTSSGWKTGILAYGNTWVNAMDCRFEDNQVGFHFNATADAVSHTIYSDNEFTNNGTAVLLESVLTDVSLRFPGSVFSGNGTDIDNRCNQDLDISQAIFR